MTPSSGALAVAEKAKPASNILCMLLDTGERYLSTPLFENISVDMTDDEHEIARSTPNFRLDAPPPVPDEKPQKEPVLHVDESAFLPS